MASSWRIVRGAVTNRVRKGQKHLARAGRVKVTPNRRPNLVTGDKLYTTICVGLTVDELIAIDDAADRAGMNRSRFLVEAALRG